MENAPINARLASRNPTTLQPFGRTHRFRRSRFGQIVFTLSLLPLLFPRASFAQTLELNDSEYFETRGVNVLVFSNRYTGMFNDEKNAGIELIHHGVRTATGGGVRLSNTPEQWDLIPEVVDRTVDASNGSIEVLLRYADYEFDSRIRVTPVDKGVVISVYLDKPLPDELVGHAGLNMEFIPSSYFRKTYLVDGKPDVFPRYPAGPTHIESVDNKIQQYFGHSTFDDRGRGEFIVPEPLATGGTLVLAPEDPEHRVTIHGLDAELMLFDGRILAQNGWYVVRSLLPGGQSGRVLQWYLEPNSIEDWVRTPVIQFSQAGYHPDHEKVAVIELDRNDTPLAEASLYQVTADGWNVERLADDVTNWGEYTRYNYVTFDFSSVTEPGVYFIRYGDESSNTFVISDDVYENVWQATMDVFYPVQMDHMKVNEGYRTWHGASYLDDAIQAPVNHQHFDGYRMGPTTDTVYEPGERIPGLAVGGWYDAGDFDIQTGSHNAVVSGLVDAWETFGIDRDQTYIDQATRYVDIHRPDGEPDILQQIEHGTLNLVAQVENIGHPVRGIIVPNLHQYHHLGDSVTETDNLPYNPDLEPYETDGVSSGTPDDRWVFTNRSAGLDYSTAGALAAAARALDGFNKPLADRAMAAALKLWDENAEPGAQAAQGFRGAGEMNAAFQLFVTTGESKYGDRFLELLWPMFDSPFGARFGMGIALQAVPYMDDAFKERLRSHVETYKATVDAYEEENPFGVPIGQGGWGGNGTVIGFGITNYRAHKHFPDIVPKEDVLKGLHYLYGRHPYSNVSFVSSVGTVSKEVAYGINRVDFAFIAGGIVPGLIMFQPDFLENKEDWPFFWGENEYVIGIGATYVFLAHAANEIVNE